MKNAIFTLLLLFTSVCFGQTVLLDDQVLGNANVTGNGTFELYNSGPINTNPYEGIEVDIIYENQVPSFDNGFLPYHQIVLVVEKQTTAGDWFPFISQNDPFVKEESHRAFAFQYDPSVITFDEGQGQYRGDRTVIYKERGRLSETIRIRILITENKHGTADEFQSIKVDLIYELFNS